jgi:nucleoside-diphosphate-sugar epimerase
MEPSAQRKLNLLITDAGSFLGSNLSRHFLSQGHTVYGIGNNNPPEDILSNHNFTFAEIDLAQPIPQHIPKFDIILNLANEITSTGTFNQTASLPPQTANLINIAKTGAVKVIFLAPIYASTQLFESIGQEQQLKNSLKLLLVGDVYGPDMPLTDVVNKPRKNLDYFSSGNKLAALISQVVTTDKVILEKEGTEMIYPTYIEDAIYAVGKSITTKDHKNIRFVISQQPARTLSVAYEIQTSARNVLSKELGLFFAGPKQEIEQTVEPIIRISELGYSPKVGLVEGLEKTLQSFKERDIVTPQQPTQYVVEKKRPEALAVEERKQQLTQLKQKKLPTLPRLPGRFNLKKLLAVLLIIIFLTIAKTGLDIFLGIHNATLAKNSLMAGDFTGAQKKAESSSNSFKAAYNKTTALTYPFKFVFKNQVSGLNGILLALSKGVQSLTFFAQATQIYTQDIKSIIDKNSNSDNLDFETPTADYQSAYFLSAEASELINNANFKLFAGKIKTAEESLNSVNQLSESALELVNFTGDLVGQGGKKTYLALLQNNTELRPGGGFIGNYAVIEFENGKFQNVAVDDIYNIDGQLKEKIDPPPQITEKLGTKQLFLRDSNWSTDFLLNSATARDLYKKETGKDVNGVIALDLTYIQSLLDKIGPVKLPDYSETITAQNLFERGEYHSEVGFFPGSTQKKDFFGTLTNNLFQNITTKLTADATSQNPVPWTGIILATKDALSQRHLMFAFDDPNLAAFVKTKGWDHPLPPTLYNPADDSKGTRDFLALSEANLGANKANRLIERSVVYEMTIGRDADLVAKLSIIYKNNSQADTWPAGKYVNYLRVYVPFAASLFAVQNGDNSNIKDVEITTQNNMTVLATYMEVPIKSTKTITFSYRIPKNIKLEQAPSYNLYVQKQPGTDKDPFTFRLNLPGYLVVKSTNNSDEFQDKQNIEINTNLATDQQFEIGIGKK